MPKIRDTEHSIALGRRLRARREWLGLTLADVSRETSVSCTQVQRYETGRDDPSTATLVKLAAVLDCPPANLLQVDKIFDPFEEATTFLTQPSVAAIVRRLRQMSDDQRKRAHAVLCALEAMP